MSNTLIATYANETSASIMTNGANSTKAVELAELIRENNSLHELTTNIADNGSIRLILESLPHNNTLRKLSLHCYYNNENIERIINALNVSNIEILELGIADHASVVPFESLQIVELQLWCEARVRNLDKLLLRTSLTKLSIDGIVIPEADIEKISDALKTNNALTKFKVVSTMLSDEANTQIITGLRDNTSIKSVKITTGTNSTNYISNLLKKNKTIESLSCRGFFNTTLIDGIIEGLNDNTTLKKLDITSCRYISNDNFKLLLGSNLEKLAIMASAITDYTPLKDNNSLIKLHMFDNTIPVDSITSFVDSLKYNTTLQELRLVNLTCNRDFLLELAQALQENNTLKKLHFIFHERTRQQVRGTVIDEFKKLLECNDSLESITGLNSEIDEILNSSERKRLISRFRRTKPAAH